MQATHLIAVSLTPALFVHLKRLSITQYAFMQQAENLSLFLVKKPNYIPEVEFLREVRKIEGVARVEQVRAPSTR